MAKQSLNPDDLQVTTFQTDQAAMYASTIGGGNSWPDVCTCIGICQPSADLYCSGGCAPSISKVDQQVAY
jgi:hypothetical protein